MDGYLERNNNLRAMGFADYSEYLSSALWLLIKSRVLSRDNGRCRICGDFARTVHHMDYSLHVLRGNRDDKLLSVCDGCHQKVEFTGPNLDVKLSMEEAVRKTKKLLEIGSKQRKPKRRKGGGKLWIGLSYKAKHLLRKGRK